MNVGTFNYLKGKNSISRKGLSPARKSEATNEFYDEGLSLGTSKFCSCLSGSELSYTLGGYTSRTVHLFAACLNNYHAFMIPKRKSRVLYLHLQSRMFQIVLNIYPEYKKGF